MAALWLAQVLRAEGLDVVEVDGWETRATRPGFDPAGIVCHHTATGPNWQDGHVAALLREGRRDLAGPLSQMGLERDGTFVVIAAGRCNHNGGGPDGHGGVTNPLWGNDSFGIEAYNDGQGESWPKVQLDAYLRGCAAICRRMGWGVSQIKGHKETDPTRKIDPAGIDMDRFRASVQILLTPKPTPNPIPIPQPVQERERMAYLIKQNGKPEVWVLDDSGPAGTMRHVRSQADVLGLAKALGPVAEVDEGTFANQTRNRTKVS